MALALSTTLLNNGSLRLQNPFSHRPDLSASFYPSCSRSGSPMKPLLALRSHFKPLVASTEGSKERSKTNLATQAKLHPRRWLFSLRLRPRLRLLSSRLRMFSFRGFEEEARNVFSRNRKRITLSAVVLAVLGFYFLFLKLTAEPAVKVMPYSELVTRIQNGHVSAVQFEEGSRRIFYSTRFDPQNDDSLANDEGENTLGSLKNGKNAGVKWEYSTRRIDHDENFLLGLMREKGTMYSSAPQSVVSTLRGMLILVIPLWISLTPTMWFLHRYLSAANSPAKKRKPSNQKVRFDDVEGVDAAKEELMEIVSCLRGSINYKKLGAKLPRGVLLVGRPGTGKTLLARSVAGEAGVPFFSVSASEFVELFVGRGAARIRDLFKVAKKCSPSIVFIDELDAVGGRRGRSFNDERDQTLNQLLTEMDGFESDVRVIVIAATNRPEALDPALCRPGRFSRKVLVGEPDLEGRKRILAVHLRGIPLEEEPQIISDLVACLTPGYVGADLANIVNEAALLAARRGGERVTRRDIMDALERAKFGINDKRLASAATKCLGKLLPWMQRRDAKSDDLHALLGYQTLN